MKVTDYIAQRLEQEGITHVFLVQGGANNDLIYSIADRENMRYVAMNHEQAAGFAAEGWAKVRGTTGCAVATSGPGGHNLVTPIANCFYDSVPCLFITGQVNSKFLRPSKSIRQVGFQETDIDAIVEPITKMSCRVMDAKMLPYLLDQALWLCRSGRPGPVLLDIPTDIQKQDIDLAHCTQWHDPLIDTCRKEHVDHVIEKLKTARRPVMLIGGGARGAESAFMALAAALKIPCFPTWNALDIVASDNPYYAGRVGTYGGSGRNFAIQNCDLLLCIGTRLSGRITGGIPKQFAREAYRITVDIDVHALFQKNQQLPFHYNIHADANNFMGALEFQIRQQTIHGHDMGGSYNNPLLPDWHTWLDTVMMWKRKYDLETAAPIETAPALNPYAVTRDLAALLPEDAIIVTDCGGNVVVMNQAFATKTGQRFFSNNGNSPMGFSFAAAIGAWFADPSRVIVCVIGDGGMQMNIQDLQTLCNYPIDIKVLIYNNHCYGITRAFQETHYEGRLEASVRGRGYSAPNFCEIAAAYGLSHARIDKNSDVVESLYALLLDSRSVIVDVDIGDFHKYEPRIFGWDTPIEDMYPYLPREEFRKNMLVEPVEGWHTPRMPG